MDTELVLVTGCTGFVGSWVLKCAVDRGFRVRGTTRSRQSERSQALLALFPELQLVECELTSDENWDFAMEGVDILMHTASPYHWDQSFDFVTPAVEGTRRVTNAAIAAGCKTIIVTSSVWPMVVKQRFDDLDGRTFSEKDWAEETRPRFDEKSYEMSKLAAEEEFFNILKGNRQVHGATVLPSSIWGPILIPIGASGSVNYVKDILLGGQGAFGTPMAGCDVRDVAEMHFAALNPEAKDRRLIVVSHIDGIVGYDIQYTTIMSKEFTPLGYTFPSKTVPSCFLYCLACCCCCCIPGLCDLVQTMGAEFRFDTEFSIKMLGREFYTCEEALLAFTYDLAKQGKMEVTDAMKEALKDRPDSTSLNSANGFKRG